MHRLKTRAQFQAAMAGGVVSRTAHFALHRLVLPVSTSAAAHPPGPGSLPAEQGPQALFGVPGVWMGAMAPKRWARRAVTRNAIKRQVYALGTALEPRLPPAAFVVRLRAGFDRRQFPSAWSEPLRQAVRAELQQLLARVAHPAHPARPEALA
ncbi:MAG: ribonuclease P protein component [Comamonadaceae bacterium]|nr:ribonuclease P protein component [Comamonadaceae bacterium]